MDGPNFTIGCVYSLFVFTLVLIIKSDSVWIHMLPLMTLLALAYVVVLVGAVLVMLKLLKMIMDLFDAINGVYNSPQGKFFGQFFT